MRMAASATSKHLRSMEGFPVSHHLAARILPTSSSDFFPHPSRATASLASEYVAGGQASQPGPQLAGIVIPTSHKGMGDGMGRLSHMGSHAARHDGGIDVERHAGKTGRKQFLR